MVTGMDETCAAIMAAADRIEKAAQTGVKAACDAVCAEAKAMCPVRTGNLRASIEASVSANEGTVFAGADYGVYVELGTYKMAAQPFLSPALFAAVPAIAAAVLSEV